MTDPNEHWKIYRAIEDYVYRCYGVDPKENKEGFGKALTELNVPADIRSWLIAHCDPGEQWPV